MKYDYKCENETCEEITEIELPLADDKPESVTCSKCGKKAKRYWKSNFIVLPEDFKTASNMESWQNRHGKFPPGVRGKYTRGGGAK